MRRLLIFFAALLLFVEISYAQLELKPAIGVNITDISKNPDAGNAVGRVGWQAGISALYGYEWYGEAGIFFAKKSTEFPANAQNNQEYTSEFKGVRIPLTLGYHIIGEEGEAINLRAFGGMSFLFITDVETLNYSKDDFKNSTTGIFAGLGVDFLAFFLETKYEWSLTDVSKVPDFDIGQHRSFFVSAGVRFPL